MNDRVLKAEKDEERVERKKSVKMCEELRKALNVCEKRNGVCV